jgi:hypothetical protein
MGRNTRYLIIIPAILFALFAKPAKAVEVPPNPYYNPPQNLTVESAPNDGITVKWYPPEVSNYDRIDIYVIEFYRLTDGVESGGWAVWTDSENHAYTFGSWIFDYTGNNLRFKIKAGSDACVGRPDPVGYCLYGTKASVDADATNLPELAPEETTTTWASTTSSTTSTTTSTTTVPSTTVPVTNPTTTTVQETTTTSSSSTTTSTTSIPELQQQRNLRSTTSVANSTSTTTSSVPQTTTTESTTTTTQPPPTQTSTPPTTTLPEPSTTTTSTTIEATTTTVPPPSTTTTTVQPTTTTSVPPTTTIALESPQTTLPAVLSDVTPTQALTVALATETLQTLSASQATEIFASLPTDTLTNTQIADITEAVQDAPTEVRESFEEEVDVFKAGFDDYVPLGSTIPVGERRTLIAVTAGITLAAAGTRIRR